MITPEETQTEFVYFEGRQFADNQALHEWRLIFDFQYYLDYLFTL